jgi:stage II sporulation protein D
VVIMPSRLVKNAVGACRLALLLALLLALTSPTLATAAPQRFSVRGAGYGHGVGLSQYGAYGYALHGVGYKDILHHYYAQTRIASVGASVVRVLLQANKSTIHFSGATSAGTRKLKEGSTYGATRRGTNVVLRGPSGRRLGTYPAELPVFGGTSLRLHGVALNGVRSGLYRGSLEIRAAVGPHLNAINTVGMESYLQGVVPAESPPIWPAAALQAQAVAARSYALATQVAGRQFDQYADTRSQMYKGISAETPTATAAVAATRGEVVMYGGEVALTYFFSTSGGYTENVENVFRGSDPKPWLRGVRDPYDGLSPYHRWGPYTWSRKVVQRKLRGLVSGRFRRIDVLQRGVSPRVVRATVRGSRGSRIVSGSQLRAALGLRDNWFYVRRVSTRRSQTARTSSADRSLAFVSGRVDGARGRSVALQQLYQGRWTTVEDVPLHRSRRTATYRTSVGQRGIYRVLAGWAPGPAFEVK